jgi:hypothetical protein
VVVWVSFRVVVEPDHGSVVCVVRWVVISGAADGLTTVVGSMVQELRAVATATAVRIRIDDGFMALMAWVTAATVVRRQHWPELQQFGC